MAFASTGAASPPAVVRYPQSPALCAPSSQPARPLSSRRHAEYNGVILRNAPAVAEPSALAVVSLDDAGHAAYDFYLNGSADWQWTTSELTMPAETTMLHFGSLASWLAPGDTPIAEFAT